MFSPCLCAFPLCVLHSSRSPKTYTLGRKQHTELPVHLNVTVYMFLSTCFSPKIDWRPVQGAHCLPCKVLWAKTGSSTTPLNSITAAAWKKNPLSISILNLPRAERKAGKLVYFQRFNLFPPIPSAFIVYQYLYVSEQHPQSNVE